MIDAPASRDHRANRRSSATRGGGGGARAPPAAPRPARGPTAAGPRAAWARRTGMATSESGGRLDGGLTTATYVRMIRPSSWRHDVEWTTKGVSGYHLNT